MPVLPARLAAALLPQRPRPAAACPAPPPMAASRNCAASDSAGPQAQRSAPAPMPAPRQPALKRPANQPAHGAARPPAQQAPHRQNQHDHRAHPDTTTQDHPAHASWLTGVPAQPRTVMPHTNGPDQLPCGNAEWIFSTALWQPTALAVRVPGELRSRVSSRAGRCQVARRRPLGLIRQATGF
jgi:hypothetical protein